MDKEKQIEEIAEIMCGNETSCGDCFLQYEKTVWKRKITDRAKHCEIYRYAQNLVNKNYRKINENEVVISKEEYENDFSNQFNKGYKNGCKETAKEILERGKYCMPSGLREWIIKHYGVDLGGTK